MSINWVQVAEELFQLAEDVLEEDEELSEEYVNAARLIQETLVEESV
jgi:RNase P subunit RPR2